MHYIKSAAPPLTQALSLCKPEVQKGQTLRYLVVVSSLSIALVAGGCNSAATAQSGGLVNDKRELVCPHASARALNNFASETTQTASRFSSALYSGDSHGLWAYTNAKKEEIPTLREDGSTLDSLHPNNAGLLLYENRNGGHEQSYWSRRFDENEIISSGTHQKNEGVDDLARIRAEVSQKTLNLLQMPNGSNVFKDMIWTDTILMQESDVPESSKLGTFRTTNEQFIRSFPAREMKQIPDAKTLFLTTAMTSGGEEIITLFTPSISQHYGHWVGEMHVVSKDQLHHRQLVEDYFKQVPKGGRVYVYGAELKSIDLSSIAVMHNLEIVYRGPTIIKSFPETDRQLRIIAGRRLRPESTSVLNGIPSTEEELEAMDKPSSASQTWSDFKMSVEDKLKGHFSERIESRAQLFKELTEGDNDVLFLFAHFDGSAFYFGKERISLAELEALPSRDLHAERPRTAILVICNAGKLSPAERSLFRRQRQSMGEILVKKNLFQKVVAPDHEIESAESLRALSDYLSVNRIDQKGWMTLADVLFPVALPE